MSDKKDLRQLLHPYMFVLKEGQGFQSNLLDYHLMILHVNCSEVIRSPRRSLKMHPSRIDAVNANLISPHNPPAPLV